MSSETRQYVLEQVDEAAVVQLYADGFAALSLREKTLIWHLYLAALAGRDIYYDQRYAHGLEMRAVLEAILTHGQNIERRVREELRRYTKLFWINSGPYNNLTARKFLLKLTKEQLIAAMEVAAANGARFDRENGASIAQLVDRYAPMFFDPAFEPMVTFKTPGPGQDILPL